jgi:hypothetical protein
LLVGRIDEDETASFGGGGECEECFETVPVMYTWTSAEMALKFRLALGHDFDESQPVVGTG